MKLRVAVFLFWLLLFSVLTLLHTVNYQKSVTEQIERETLLLNSRINVTIENLSRFSRYSFETTVNTEQVQLLMAQALNGDAEEQNRCRTELYRIMFPIYEQMTRYHFRQLHFHFPPATSFLRMHAPDFFGDDLSEIRRTILLANSAREPVKGFEEGRIFNGYRFVYPLFHNNTHCGSVEVSFSMGSFLDILSRLSDSTFLFAIRREIVEQTVFREKQNNYTDSMVAPDLVSDTAIPENPDWAPFFAGCRKTINRKLTGIQDFGFYYRHNGHDHLVVFKSLKNIQGEHVAWIISVSRDNARSEAWKTLIKLLSVTFLATVIIEILSWLFLTDRIRLASMARTDQLTGAANRRGFTERVNHEIAMANRYGTSLGLILFDVDRFKTVNDSLGHAEGDRILKMITSQVSGIIRSSDILARWGGDEFVLALPHCAKDDTGRVAEKIRLAIHAAQPDKSEPVTLSLGYTLYQKGESLDEMIARADKALYQAKEKGRDQYSAAP